MELIYLDNASTTQISDEVNDIVRYFDAQAFFNPSAGYRVACEASDAVEQARIQVAHRLGVEPRTLYFTSSATESNNWAIARGLRRKTDNIVISAGEHPSIYESAQSSGAQVRLVPLSPTGAVDMDKLAQACDADTGLVSLIHLSNETGAVNDIATACALVRQHSPRALVHSDGVQAFTKLATSPVGLGVDLYSISAHKIGGVKGAGALYIRQGLNFGPLLYGGGQERGLRSGTQNVSAIAGFGVAAQRVACLDSLALRTAFLDTLGQYCHFAVNGQLDTCHPSIVSVAFQQVRAEVLQTVLSDAGIIIGIGSACATRKSGNRTLQSMGVSSRLISGSVRISFGASNTVEQAQYAARIIGQKVTQFQQKR